MIVLPWLLLLITITACVVLYLVTTKGMLTCYLDFNDTLFLQQSQDQMVNSSCVAILHYYYILLKENQINTPAPSAVHIK